MYDCNPAGLFVKSDFLYAAAGSVAYDKFGKRVFDMLLDGPLERSGTKFGIVSLVCYERTGGLGHLKFISQVADSIGKIFQFYIYYSENVLP